MSRLLLLATVAATSVRADLVELACGDRITGRIESLSLTNLTVTNAYAGRLTVDRRFVVRLATDRALQVATTNGARFEGRLDARPDGRLALISTGGDTHVLAPAAIACAWPPGTPDPTVPATSRNWKHAVTADFSGRRGNTDTTAAGGGLEIKAASTNADLKFYAKGRYGESDDVLTERQLQAGADYEWRVLSKHACYARDELEKDDIVGIRLRNLLAAGYGYYAFRNPGRELRLRLGLGHAVTDYKDVTVEDTSSVTLDSGIRFRYKLGAHAAWSTDLAYEPPFENLSHYYITHESKLSIPLSVPQLTEEFGVANQYVSTPGAQRGSLDTTYFARTKLSW